MTDRIRSILQRLEQTREDLLALSDDIWLSIDHNDNHALQEGVAFKKEYNVKVTAFDQLAGELSELVQRFTAVRLDAVVAPLNQTPQSRDRIIRELDQRQGYRIDEDWTFKRPYGFQLGKDHQAKVNTWRQMYVLICIYLRQRDPKRFARLPNDPVFITRRGNPMFSRDPQDLRSAIELTDGIYAEANLSANHIRDQIKVLLDCFGIDHQELIIFLRQDRDAEGEN